MNDFFRACVEELETTTALQGRTYLHQKYDDGQEAFCCLGLFCLKYIELIGPLRVTKDVFRRRGSNPVAGVRYNGEESAMPPEVMKALGLQTHLGVYVKSDGSHSSLAIANDTGHSFKQIAEIMKGVGPDEWYSYAGPNIHQKYEP